MSPPLRAPMTREQVDHALATLRPGYDRIATAMYGLDSHAGLGFLRDSSLSGASRTVAQEATALMTLLWAQFTALGQHLDRAKEVRAARSRPGDEELATLTVLLREPVVALGEDGVPVDPAQLSGSGAPVSLPEPVGRTTLADLAQGLETACAELAEQLTEVDAAVAAVAGRLATLTDALGQVQAMAAPLGQAEILDKLTPALDEVREQGLADPIGAARGGVPGFEDRLRRLTTDLDAARGRLDELVRVRDEHPRRVAKLRDAIDEVARAEAGVAEVYEVVHVKIANPGLPEAPAAAGSLRERLPPLERLGQEQRWTRLSDELAALEHATAEAHSFADRLRSAAEGLLDRRTELRGRLGAYRAKAARLGYSEHPVLSARHREAHGLLYTSPCDLPAATRAVFSFQQALADLNPGEETAR